MKKLDVTDDALVKDVVESVIKEHGKLDVLINNAGFGTRLTVEQQDLASHQSLFDTNYFGMVSRSHRDHCCAAFDGILSCRARVFNGTFSVSPWMQVRMIQAVLPHMRAAKSGQIINITSLVGFSAIPFSDAYSASKFAVNSPLSPSPVYQTRAAFPACLCHVVLF